MDVTGNLYGAGVILLAGADVILFQNVRSGVFEDPGGEIDAADASAAATARRETMEESANLFRFTASVLEAAPSVLHRSYRAFAVGVAADIDVRHFVANRSVLAQQRSTPAAWQEMSAVTRVNLHQLRSDGLFSAAGNLRSVDTTGRAVTVLGRTKACIRQLWAQLQTLPITRLELLEFVPALGRDAFLRGTHAYCVSGQQRRDPTPHQRRRRMMAADFFDTDDVPAASADSATGGPDAGAVGGGMLAAGNSASGGGGPADAGGTMATNEDDEGAAHRTFIESTEFRGAKVGYFFRSGASGLGYYLLLPPASVAEPPAPPVALPPAGELTFDRALLPQQFPEVFPIGRWHHNARRPQPLSLVRLAADTTAYSAPTTEHMPIPWWHRLQSDRATAAGFAFDRMEGPSPYGTFQMPQSMQELTANMDKDTATAEPDGWTSSRLYLDAYCEQIAEVERHPLNKFKFSQLPNGQDGWSWPWQRHNPLWGRFIWKEGPGGVPQIVTEELPDAHTEIKIFDLYKDSRLLPVKDKYITSMFGLYGAVSSSACSMSSALTPNYKSGFEKLAVLQEQSRAKEEDFGLPRVSPATRTAQTWPFKDLPLGVAVQEKVSMVDGQLSSRMKDRGCVDAGALRQKRKHSGFGRRLSSKRARGEKRTQKVITKLRALAERLEEISSRKSPPGEDSPNACIDLSQFAKMEYGSAAEFVKAVDILLSAELKVDIALWDFKSWYNQFNRAVIEQWMQHQVVSSAGASIDFRGCFGWADLCALLKRVNFAIVDIIIGELRDKQAAFDVDSLDAAMRQRLTEWTQLRQQNGFSGDWFTALPFFDDNSIAAFSLGGRWTAVVRETAIGVWDRYHKEMSPEKEALNMHDEADPEPIIGNIVSMADRERRLPPAKQLQYAAALDAVLAAATAHGKDMVPKKLVDSLMGRLVNAALCGCATLWPDFLGLVSSLAPSWSAHHVQVHQRARAILQQIRWKLMHENGCAFTPFEAKPTRDSFPVYVTYTDASLKLDGTAGYGGFIWRHGSAHVEYFFGRWDPELVAKGGLDINDLEAKVGNIASVLANEAADRDNVGCRYVVQIGDSSVWFDSVMPLGHPHSAGLRFLHREKSEQDRQFDVISCTLAVPRELNKPADSLSNGDVPLFESQLRELLGHVSLTRLDVSESLCSVEALAQWKLSCA